MIEDFDHDSWTEYMSFSEPTRAHLAYQQHIDIRTFTSDSGEGWTTGTPGPIAALAKYPGLELTFAGAETKSPVSVTLTHILDLLTGFEDSDLITFALVQEAGVIVGNESFLDLTSHAEGKFEAATTASVAIGLEATDNQFLVPRSEFENGKLDLSKVTAVRFRVKSSKAGKVYLVGLKLVLASRHISKAEAEALTPKAQPMVVDEGGGKFKQRLQAVIGFGGGLHEHTPGWQRPSVDYDNWNKRLRKPTPLDGNVADVPVFAQGPIWKSSSLSGPNDPTPIDVKMGVVFNTGSQAGDDRVTLFFREESFIFQSMLDLIGVTMAELDGHPLPDLGTAEFLPRHIGEFENEPMEVFDDKQTMESLERTPVENPELESWVYFELRWGTENKVFMGNNAPEANYELAHAGFANNKNYLMVGELEDSMARIRIYELENDFKVIQEPVFDSTLIDDDGIFRRRKGRIGWSAKLDDNDAYISNIRPRGVCFAEYRSAPLESVTPVDGAQLFADYTANTELWDKGLNQYTTTELTDAIVTRDKARSTTGESFKITTKGKAGQGWVTDPIVFTDFDQMQIEFDLWFEGEPREIENRSITHPAQYPSKRKLWKEGFQADRHTAYPSDKTLPKGGLYPSSGYTKIEEEMTNSIVAELVDENNVVTVLRMPEIEPSQWQHIKLTIPSDEVIQTGTYRLRIIQPTKLSTSWWIDGIKIFQRAVQWSARSVIDDPWHSNYAPWTDFREIINVQHSGVFLKPRGKELQMRARALRQDATIKQPKIVPRYAQLGRLVWPEDALTGLTPPVAEFKAVKKGEGKTFAFTDESTGGSGAIVQHDWSFGDGSRSSGNDEYVTHEYATGTYTATLIILNRNGKLASEKVEIVVP